MKVSVHLSSRDAAIVFESGQRHAVIGPCGSGKTALALALVGHTAPHSGIRVEHEGGDVPQRAAFFARNMGYVPTSCRQLFTAIFDTVEEELAFGCHLVHRGMQFDDSQQLQSLGVDRLLGRDPATLSGGEAALVALAAQLLKRPAVLVIDQLFEQLDSSNRIRVATALAKLAQAGTTVIEMHAQPQTLTGHYDKVDRLGNAATPAGELEQLTPAHPAVKEESAYRARGVNFQYAASSFSLHVGTINVRRGEMVVLVGPNGSGKTTLLRSIGLLLDASFNAAQVTGADGKSSSPPETARYRWAGSVQYCFQEPRDQIYRATLLAEVAENALNIGMPKIEAEERALQYVRLLELGSPQGNPFELPRSRQRLLLIASALVAAPPLLLLDEPTADLDLNQRYLLGQALLGYLRSGGSCVAVTHDEGFARLAHTRWRMSEGRLCT